MNNDITEDYCSFEVSKFLKEKECKILANSVYVLDWNKEIEPALDSKLRAKITSTTGKGITNFRNDIEKFPNYCAKITHSLAIKWIRENFGLFISPYYLKSFKWCIQVIDTKELENIDSGIRYTESKFNSSEEAIEAALLYTLKNLIP